MKAYLYVWDITDGIKDRFIYKVEYLGKPDAIEPDARERAVNKARYMAVKLNGNRKCFLQENDGFYPYSGCCLVTVEVPANTPQLKKWLGKVAKPIAEYDDGDEIDWAMFCDNLAAKMAGHEYFKIEGRNLDWLHHDGQKLVHADTPAKLLEAMHNEGMIELYNGKRSDEFKLRIPSHDCPMGSHYYIKPISEKTYQLSKGY